MSPCTTVWLEFDRVLDQSTFTPQAIQFSPAATWTPDYNENTKTLTLLPGALEGETQYTVTVTKALKGADGSEMQGEYAWAFTTKKAPSGSVLINSGAGYTNSNLVTLYINYNSEVQMMRYSQNKDDITNDVIGWAPVPVDHLVLNYPLTGADGTNTVYIQFQSFDGITRTDEVNPLNDSIVLDRDPPDVSSFVINENEVSTLSQRVALSNNVTDLTGILMRFQNAGGVWTEWEKYATSRTWTLDKNTGTRTVYAEFKDAATNVASVHDSIILGKVGVTSASLGNANIANLGTVTVNWNAATADLGTNVYHVYRRDYPSGSVYTELGTTTSNSLAVSVPKGQIYYFHVAIANTEAGGTGDYSTSNVVGYTSNIAIVYNDGSSPDTTIAQDMKTILTSNLPATPPYSSYVTGTMPSWTVTLVPQSLVSTAYNSSTIHYGYPLIVTPGITFYSNLNQVRNVTAHIGAVSDGHGVFAMGTGGAQLLDTVHSNWAALGYTGTNPLNIGWGPSATGIVSRYMYTWTSAGGNTVWSSPLASSAFTGTLPTPDRTRTYISSTSVGRVSVYRGANDNPTPDGYLYGHEDRTPVPAYYYPVVRQGRFLQFGFEQETDYPYTGWVYIINLAYRMSNIYYH